MDNVTHALAGCLLAGAVVTVAERRGVEVSPRFRVAATALGIATAELPDIDLVYAGSSLGMGKLGYLLHHRGHTHTVLFAIGGALLLWGIALLIRKDLRTRPRLNALLALALLGTLSHLALDYTNNYGVHPFWPIVNRWYYGDSVFIVEPWLWVIAIPALVAFYKGRVARAMLVLLLVIILSASWLVGMVGTGVATALTASAVAWILLMRATTAPRRIPFAIAVWCAAEMVFAVSSSRSRNAVIGALDAGTFRDVSLTPFIGNPLCSRALLVEITGSRYSVTGATVAPFPAIRNATECAGGSDISGFDALPTPNSVSTHVSTGSVRWSDEWSAPLSDLQRLVRTHCEVAAAMEFIRIPVWAELANGDVEISDARFGSGARNFASVTASLRPAMCPRWLPGWTPPRADLLQ